MLILTRRPGEAIAVGDEIVIEVLAVDGQQVRLGFEAPKVVRIMREELLSSFEAT
jgi:carbon storage regulator